MSITITGIRTAALPLDDYLTFLAEPDPYKGVDRALSYPVVVATLKSFSPFAYKHIVDIRDRNLDPQSKKGRKALRHLTTTMARLSTRATPSRIAGRIGTVDSLNAREGIVLEAGWRATAIEPSPLRLTPEDLIELPSHVRWNPSVIAAGDFFYLVAPRSEKNLPYSTVKSNNLITYIGEESQAGIACKILVEKIVNKYNLTSTAPAVKAIHSLINTEFLLTEGDSSFTATRPNKIKSSLNGASANAAQLYEWLKENSDCEIEATRNACANIPRSEFKVIEDAYSKLIELGLINSTDHGLAHHFAILLHEQFGYSRVRFTDLIHPGVGFSYREILNDYQRKQMTKPSANIVTLASSNQTWIDLSGDHDLQVERHPQWRAPQSFSVPVMESVDTDGNYLHLVCDSTVALPASALTARFSTYPESASVSYPPSSSTVSLNWTSPRRDINAIRESEQHSSYSLNVNAFSSNSDEVTPRDIFLWSDNEHVYLELESGIPIEISPQSMLSMMLYPDSIALLLLASTDGWPSMKFTWEEVEQYHDRLPGIRYKNVIVARPRYRYKGKAEIEEFLAWCQSIGLRGLIRIGAMDRKVLIDINSPGSRTALLHLLKTSNNWVEDASYDGAHPLAITADTKQNVVSELVFTLGFAQNLQSPKPMQNPELSKEISIQEDDFLIPGSGSVANFEIVPRSVRVDSLLARIEESLPEYSYFIRYVTNTSSPCIRLRISREQLRLHSVQSAFAKLLMEGWATDISEKVHRQEVERYGGRASFEKFVQLFSAESHFVGCLAQEQVLEELKLEQKALYLEEWLRLAEIAGVQCLDRLFEMRGTDKSSPTIKVASTLPEVSFWTSTAASIIDAMRDISSMIPVADLSWSSAAHMWCNRLGINSNDEPAVWKALWQRKLQREPHRDSK